METTTETPGQSSTSEADHFDQIEVEPEAGEAAPVSEAEGGAASLPVGADGLLTFEGFNEGFKAAFLIGGDLTGLQTLKAAPDQATAVPASRALYDTLKEIPWMHWMLHPGGKWMQRAILIGAFSAPLYLGCREEMKARRAKPVQADESTAAPANDDIPEDGAVLR